MDTNLLRAFILVARHLNFTRAAEQLGLSQSSLSRQILHLERLLGGRVFDRGPRHVRLTPLGEELLPRAEELMVDVRSFLAVAESFTEGHRTRLVLGVAANTHDRLAVSLLGGLRASFPEMQFVIRQVGLGAQAEALEEFEVDALVARPPLETDKVEVECIHLSDDRLVLVVPPDHPLAERETVTEADVADLAVRSQPWLPRSWREEIPLLEGDPDSAPALDASDFRDVVVGVAIDGTPGVVPESFLGPLDSGSVVAIPITDIAPLSLQLAFLSERADEPAIAALAKVADDLPSTRVARLLDLGTSLRTTTSDQPLVFDPDERDAVAAE